MRPTHGLKPSYSAPEGGWQHLPSNGISYLLSARLQALLRCTVPASALIHRPQGLDPRGGEPKGKGKEKGRLDFVEEPLQDAVVDTIAPRDTRQLIIQKQ